MSDPINEKMPGLFQGLQIFADCLEKAYNWYQENAENISNFISAFAELGVWSVAVDKLIEHQYVFTDDITPEIANEITKADDIDAVVSKYYFDNNERHMQQLIERCRNAEPAQQYKELFEQIIAAYNVQHYLLACIGLFSVIDGVLSNKSGIAGTNFEKRIKAISDKAAKAVELSNIERKTLCVYEAFAKLEVSPFHSSNFEQNEPKSINRHWDVHGRTHREHTKSDFLKALLWLDAIIYFTEQDFEKGGDPL